MINLKQNQILYLVVALVVIALGISLIYGWELMAAEKFASGFLAAGDFSLGVFAAGNFVIV